MCLVPDRDLRCLRRGGAGARRNYGRLPAWAKPQVDARGNLTVTFGSGGKPLVFVAHMDEVGFEIASIADDGTAAIRGRGGMYLSLYEAHPVLVATAKGPVSAVIAPRTGYTTAKEAQPAATALFVYFGTNTAAETSALGVAAGQTLTMRKKFAPMGLRRATGRAMDDRVGSTALLLALQQIDPKTVTNQVTFAWTVEEETGLAGAAHLATTLKPDTAFAIDTFVSSDTPVDTQRLAGAELGRGAVLRVLDSRTIVPPHIVDRIVAIARGGKIPLQLGTTSGGTDASAFSAGGAMDVGLSWPGRYSHSPVEVMDRARPGRAGQADRRARAPVPDDETHCPGYGTWRSPLTAARVTAGSLRFDHLVTDGDDLYWVEGRASEGGRYVVVRRSADGTVSDVTPPEFNVRTRVHEYGGAAYTVHRGVVYFSNFADQRLYEQKPGASPRPLTADGLLYADPHVTPDGRTLVAIREDHRSGDPVNHRRRDLAGRGRRTGSGERRRFLLGCSNESGRRAAGLAAMESPEHALGRHRAASRGSARGRLTGSSHSGRWRRR